MNNIVTSIFDNVKEKSSNPFFGTLIFVWLVRNWELVFTLFNFDSDCTLDDKKIFIRSYYFDKVLWQEILINIGIAFGLMLLGYILIVVSRLVVNVTNHNIIPRMNELTVSKLVVNKSRFLTVKKSRDEYFIQIEELGEKNIVLVQNNSILTTKNIELEENIKSIQNELENSIIKINVQNDINNLETSKVKDLQQDNNILNAKINNLYELQNIYDKLYNTLGIDYLTSRTFYELNKKDSALTFFIHIVEKIDQSENVKYAEEFINFFLRINVIDFKDSSLNNLYSSNNIILTELGIKIYTNKKVLNELIGKIIY